MVKILRDIKPSVKNEIPLEDLKRQKRGTPLLEDNAKQKTDFIHTRSEQAKPASNTFYLSKSNFFERYKNVLQMAAIGVAVVLIINVFSVVVKTGFLKEDLSYSAYQGYKELIDGGENIIQSNFNNAFISFNNAQRQFEEINKTLWFLNDSHGSQSGSILQDGGRLLKAGDNLSEAGKNFTKAFQHLQKGANLFFKSRETLIADFEAVQKRPSITDELVLAGENFKEAQFKLNEVQRAIENIDPNLYTSEQAPAVKSAASKLQQLNTYLGDLNNTFPAALKMLGDKHPHTYLILFHNSNELRPVLGFIGSYAVVDVNEGYIEQLKIHDVYELDGQFYEEIEDIPQEIKEIAGALKMRDSNYSPSAAVSLAKAAWFYQKQGGKSIDTVISIDQNILGQILTLMGPVQIDGLNAPVSAENYDFILSYIIENKLYGEQNPKIILNRIFEELSKRLQEENYHTQSLELLVSMIKNKQLLAYSKHEEIQTLFQKLNLTGELSVWQKGSDSLQIIRSSIGGNKSDKYIKHNYTHTSYIAANGEVTDQLKIELQHNWHAGILREWNSILRSFGYSDFSETLKDILGRGVNRSGIRVYVPQGSELLDVIGVPKDTVKKMYDKTVNREYFYTQLEVSPQTSRKISIEYRLPFKLDIADIGTYKFYYEPQIGAKNIKLSKLIRGDLALKNHKNFPKQELSPAQTIDYVVDGTTSQYFAGLWSK